MEIQMQSKCKFGLGLILPSTRHTKCQVTFRNKIRKSSYHNICEVHKPTKDINVQYDQYNSKYEALKQTCSPIESYITQKLTTKSLLLKFIQEFVDSKFINQWPNVINHLSRNIFTFTNRYLNSKLANDTNAIKYSTTNSSTYMFCDQKQSLYHVIAGCKTEFLESRCNQRHDIILLNIYNITNHKGYRLLQMYKLTRIQQPLLVMSNEQILLLLQVILCGYQNSLSVSKQT